MLRNYLTFKQIDFIQSEIISSLSVCICLYTCTRKCSIKSWSCLECKKDVFILHTPLRVWITTQWYRVILQIFFCRIPASSAKIIWLYVCMYLCGASLAAVMSCLNCFIQPLTVTPLCKFTNDLHPLCWLASFYSASFPANLFPPLICT